MSSISLAERVRGGGEWFCVPGNENFEFLGPAPLMGWV